jgi:exopolysaccharide/PEP-CTERM locus tyrosine autokinase
MGKIYNALTRFKEEKRASKPEDYMPKSLPVQEESDEERFFKEYTRDGRYSDKLFTLLAPNSVAAEIFKIIRGSILFSKDRPVPKAIMITSALPGEGKSFVATNLAVSLAMGLDQRVLLIDTDLRRPSVHRAFGYTNEYGLTDHLQGKRDISELLVKTNINKLTLLLSGEPPSNPVELLSSKRMEDFLSEAKQRYPDRFIIMDATPVRLTAETNTLARHTDGILLVVMCGETPRETILRTVEVLDKQKILGVIFNKFDQPHREYNKYYTKYYKR